MISRCILQIIEPYAVTTPAVVTSKRLMTPKSTHAFNRYIDIFSPFIQHTKESVSFHRLHICTMTMNLLWPIIIGNLLQTEGLYVVLSRTERERKRERELFTRKHLVNIKLAEPPQKMQSN